jgi:hypothetical protein
LQVLDTRATLLGDACLAPPVCPAIIYRSFDGSCNNLINPNWGRALTPLERLLPPVYEDGTIEAITLFILFFKNNILFNTN